MTVVVVSVRRWSACTRRARRIDSSRAARTAGSRVSSAPAMTSAGTRRRGGATPSKRSAAASRARRRPRSRDGGARWGARRPARPRRRTRRAAARPAARAGVRWRPRRSTRGMTPVGSVPGVPRAMPPSLGFARRPPGCRPPGDAPPLTSRAGPVGGHDGPMAGPPAAAKQFNKVALLLAGRRFVPLWAALHHRGRRSGKEYVVPIAVIPTDTTFLIALPWGPRHRLGAQRARRRGLHDPLEGRRLRLQRARVRRPGGRSRRPRAGSPA